MKKKNKKKSQLFLLSIVVVVFLVGGWFWYTSAETVGGISLNDDDIYSIQSDDVTKGNPEAKAVLIEYGDFQCGACLSMHQRIQLIWRVVKDDLYIVYRHYPLSQHDHARMASRYSEAMNRQDKFWPFHDLVYENQKEWEHSSSSDAEAMFQKFVTEAGGDLEQVKKDLEDSAIDKKIDRDMKFGELSGLTGTPTLILNGNKIDTPEDLSQFVSEIKALNK